MSMSTLSKRTSRVINFDKGVAVCRWTFDCSHGIQFLDHLQTSALILGHTYWPLTSRWVAQILEWESECRVSSTVRWNWAGTTGRGWPVDISQMRVVEEPGSGTSSSVREVDFWRVMISESVFWAAAMSSKLIPTGECGWETASVWECICCLVVPTLNMMYVWSELWNVTEVMNMPRVWWSRLADRKWVTGLWSVRTWNCWPSSRAWKCLMARYMANSSLSKVLYLLSAGFKFLEKYAMGRQSPSMCCWRTAPTPESNPSVMMLVGAFGVGWNSRVADA